MNFRPVILYAAAGLAGWLVVAWWQPAQRPDRPDKFHLFHPSRSSQNLNAPAAVLSTPAPGSAGLAGLPAFFAALTDEELEDAAAKIEKWPPGTARELAAALLAERKWKDPVNDPSTLPAEPAEPPYNRFRELAATMKQGDIMRAGGLHSGTYHDFVTLADWVSMDPAAATAAVLQMPPHGSRSAAVDVAAEVLAKHDPAAALEFYTESGDHHLGGGTAEAWEKLVLAKQPDAPRQFLDRLTRAQQDNLFASLALSIHSRDVSDPVANADLNLIARSVLQTTAVTPGLESFLGTFSGYPQAAEEVREEIESGRHISPADRRALEILWAQKLESAASSGDDLTITSLSDYVERVSHWADGQAMLDRVAPSPVSQLAGKNRLPEALQLLESIHDPDARRTSLEAVLPSWMDTDPDAARAAFDAAPLTALERERWQHHPAFLLHP